MSKIKKVIQQKKNKRQPDPILTDKTVKESGKIGSSQKKRLEKRIKKKVANFSKSKKQKVVEEKKSAEECEVNDDSQSSDNCDILSGVNDDVQMDGFDALMKEQEDDNMSEDEVTKDDQSEENDEEEAEINESEEEIDESVEEMDESEEEPAEEDIVVNIVKDDQVYKVSDPTLLQDRIERTTKLLNNFKAYKMKHPNSQDRQHFVNQWVEDLCIKYKYNKFLMKKLFYLFNMDLIEFLEKSDEQRPVTIRCNTLKITRRQLMSRLSEVDFMVQEIGFTKTGLVVYSAKHAIGCTSEYLSGHYMLQGSSSMTPVLALAPRPGDYIMDMCAAPGGKTTHIAQLMKNTGRIIANDISKERVNILCAIAQRLGVSNVILSCCDARKIYNNFRGFDRVLLDAPCTGTGVISKDMTIKSKKDEPGLKRVTVLQKQLVLAAAECLKVNGFLVYSTCSVLTEENEEVINYLCRKKHMKIVDPNLFGTPGFVNFRGRHFCNDMIKTRRYYPHTNNMDGFFVAKLQKIANGDKCTKVEEE